MSNNLNITINDFENICRTCLSREDLKPLYAKFVQSTCLVDMLTSCTFVKFAEDDGLPGQICTNCIKEINQAFSFAKRCEATDAILHECLKKETELVNNSILSLKVEPITESKREIEIEIKPESVWINTYQPEEEYAYIDEIKQEKNVEVKQDEDVKIESEYDEILDHPAEDSYSEMLNETYSTVSNNFTFSPSRPCSEYQRDEACTKEEESSLLAKPNINFSEVTLRPDVNDLKQHREDIQLLQNCEKLNVCSVCSKAFGTRQNLKIHMRIHTGEKPNVSSIGSKSYGPNYDLKRPIRIHTREKPYACEICNKAFMRKGYLISHSKIHTGEKPYVCSTCNKAFIRSQDLKTHMRIHTGEKPYTCEVCNKAFSDQRNLKNHSRIHTGEKPNVCSICSKSFGLSQDLKRHMRIHTGEKPNICSICNKTFTQLTTLKNHMRMHTREKSFSCGVCGKCFTRNYILIKHKQTHTKNTNEITANKM